MIVHDETLKSLNKLLNINYQGNEQDWSIEFANQDRVLEFIQIVKNTELSVEEKYAIVSLILASYDDYLNGHLNESDTIWDSIIKILNSDRKLYDDLLIYWALQDETDEGDLFTITPLIREYLDRNPLPGASM